MTESTEDATIKQVGGDHYASTGLQHWDLCTAHDVHYLLGCASKYVARHRQKKGREDLEKAVSYLERYALARKVSAAHYNTERLVRAYELIQWASEARLDVRDLPILHSIMCLGQHHVSIAMLREMIEEEYPDAPEMPQPSSLEQNKPGTPEDGGHHARMKYLLPRDITQFWYDHRLPSSERGFYTHNASTCRWDLQESDIIEGYDLPEACGELVE